MSATWRYILIVVAVIIAINLLLVGVNAIVPSTHGPDGSSYATAPNGVGASADLVARDGHPVSRVRGSLDHATLDPATTLVLLEPDAVLPSEGDRLRQLLLAGGRLVAGGGDPSRWLRALRVRPRWQPTGPVVAFGVGARATLGDVHVVQTAGAGSWDAAELDGFAPLLAGDPNQPLLIARSIGAGQLLLLADPSPLTNRLLSNADNAALALALAGPAGRPVAFVEGVHGYGVSRGLAALPTNWIAALVLLFVAALAFAWSRIRRLGPPEDAERELAPPRRAYVDAMAVTLERAHDPAPALDTLRERLGDGADEYASGERSGEGELVEAARSVAVLERRREGSR